MKQALVIGAGPAGLAAAEVLTDAGHAVTVADAKPTVARKFLMAGKSGLNITKNEDATTFLKAFRDSEANLAPMLGAFGPQEAIAWAETLGQEVFTGSTGRVFPKVMKASPLLRAWLAGLEAKGVTFRTRWRWTGWQKGFVFDTPDGPQTVIPDCTVLALGGASWPKLGSDGAWIAILADKDVEIKPFEASNMALHIPWSSHMQPHFGAPLKNISLSTEHRSQIGECVISANGLEGSLIYGFSPEIRAHTRLTLDLTPNLSVEDLAKRLAAQPQKLTLANVLRRALNLDKAKIALLMEWAKDRNRQTIAGCIKKLVVPAYSPAPLDKAISSTGGVAWGDVDETLTLRGHPNVFCAGEMLDWDAPTGGYLITACLATGQWAGKSAVDYLA